MTRNVTRFAVLASALTTAIVPTTTAASVGKQGAAAIAKRAASARGERFAVSYPPSTWKADGARRSAGGWRCAVGTAAQCSGVVTITGTSVRPRVRTSTSRASGEDPASDASARAGWRPNRRPDGWRGAAIVASHGAATSVGRSKAAAPASVTTTADGRVLARGTDRASGLVFTVESSARLRDNVLYITLTPSAPQPTRDALAHRPLVGTT